MVVMQKEKNADKAKGGGGEGNDMELFQNKQNLILRIAKLNSIFNLRKRWRTNDLRFPQITTVIKARKNTVHSKNFYHDLGNGVGSAVGSS